MWSFDSCRLRSVKTLHYFKQHRIRCFYHKSVCKVGHIAHKIKKSPSSMKILHTQIYLYWLHKYIFLEYIFNCIFNAKL